MHIYQPVSIDIFKRESICLQFAPKLTLPPPPDGKGTPNNTGLPRRLIFNVAIPQEAPSFFSQPVDGACYQMVLTFATTAEALAEWKAGGSAASKLFTRFAQTAPEGVLPTSGDIDLKERLKLLPRIDNMKALNLGYIAGYNGKPVLLTKSGSIYRGDDYMEISVNTFRFGIATKKGMASVLSSIGRRAEVHLALTLEGRDDSELPEQTLFALRVNGVDLVKCAKDADDL